MNVMIVDDDADSSVLLSQAVAKAGHYSFLASDARAALDEMIRQQYDVCVIDWMLPTMNGIELIDRIRKNFDPVPLIIMLTAIKNAEAKTFALKAGADDFIVKPYKPEEIIGLIKENMARKNQAAPKRLSPQEMASGTKPPPFIGVNLVASSGGPLALRNVLAYLSEGAAKFCSIFCVMHSPDWMLATLPAYLQGATKFKVEIAQDHTIAQAGRVYIAPHDKHLIVMPDTFDMRLSADEKENFVRPSADKLFRSAAAAFGRFSLGVVLTGLGIDGVQGAMRIAKNGGLVIVQKPETAMAPSLPKAVVDMKIHPYICTLDEMGPVIGKEAARLFRELS